MGHGAKVKPPKSYSFLEEDFLEVDPNYGTDKDD
jgi:hypothetical protein